MPSSPWVAVALVIALAPRGTSAQDVEMLGRHYGTRPPDAYYRELARNPNAFRFARGRAARLRSLAPLRSPGTLGVAGGAARGLGPRDQPAVGTFRIPLILGQFSDSSTPAYDAGDVQAAFFDNPSGTVSEYYDEVSSGRVSVLGDVGEWVKASLTQAQVTAGQSGLEGSQIGAFIKQLLALQVGVDWGAYDNDGPDGTPNSGDDDGYVDALAVMHPTRGAECDQSSDRIWSHKWSLSDATGSAYVTPTQSPNGGYVQVDDYFIQGVLSCNGSSLNEIGVFAHETGHAFGLPDLYDTRQSGATHGGDGVWELMATGTWGCDGSHPSLPCHMGAWSKAMLGWVDVTVVPPDSDLDPLQLPPVESSGVVLQVNAGDGSGDYFLLENRQGVSGHTYDENLLGEGVLIWQIDVDAVSARWLGNTVNAFDHMGVWLRQADGLDDLGRSGGGHGDPGDPFPGSTQNTAFHAGSNPASMSHLGTATGLTLLDVAPSGEGDMIFRLLTRFTTLTLSSSGSVGSSNGLFTVDGAPVADPPANFVVSAPFALRSLEAAAGAPVAPGERRPFIQWSDAPAEPRARMVTTPLVDREYVAEYAGTQYELHIDINGSVNDVEPGSITTAPTSPDRWFAPNARIEVTAAPQTGFEFVGWTGDLSDQPNPASVLMSQPVMAGADFEFVYLVTDAQITVEAAVQENVQLLAQNGTSPVTWKLLSGVLPAGLTLSEDGHVTGAALDLGTFPFSVEATDALGLTGTAGVTLDVLTPSLSIEQLGSRFLLTGPALDGVQATFLDRQGNRDGAYDLGDFRSWLLAHPELPLSAGVGAESAVGKVPALQLPARLDARRASR